MEVLFCGTGWLPFVDAVAERLPAGHRIRALAHHPLADALRLLAESEVVLPSNRPFDAAAFAAAPRLRLVQQPAVGVENIDVEAARARGIPVCNAPGLNAASVAEAALLLMLALARRVPQCAATFATSRIGEPVGTELRGKTLGIIGRGRSGAALARAARGLGMRVRAVNSRSGRGACERLLSGSDVVSVHVPLTARTHRLIGRAELALMQRGALLVNTARGAILDREAVEEALASGQLGGLGLDVHWAEPWDPTDPLYARSDVVVLPHIGGTTRESFGRIADLIVENIQRLVRGEPLLHVVA